MTKLRQNINLAARQVAAAWGCSVLFRDTLEPGSGKVVVRWALASPKAGWSELILVCVPSIRGHLDGWAAVVTLTGPDGEWLMSRQFIECRDNFAGRIACPLARERFCAWAATLAPNSRSATKEKPLTRMRVAALKRSYFLGTAYENS